MVKRKTKKDHGVVAGIPYDFRKPTSKKIKSSMWSKSDNVLVPKPYGIGWTLNFRNPKSYVFLGAIVAFVLGAFYLVGLI